MGGLQKYKTSAKQRAYSKLANKARYLKDPNVNRNFHFKRMYGITLEQRDEIIRRQDGKCAICGALLVLQGRSGCGVDHDHLTGVVRGVLCYYCNNGLGKFMDSIPNLESAIKYLNLHNKQGLIS